MHLVGIKLFRFLLGDTYCLQILSRKKYEKRAKRNHQLRRTLSVLNTDDAHVCSVLPLWHRPYDATVFS